MTEFNPRKVVRLRLLPDKIPYFFMSQNLEFSRKIIKGLPKNTIFLRAYYDANKDSFSLVFQNEEFLEVPEGAAMPEFECEFKINYKKEKI